MGAHIDYIVKKAKGLLFSVRNLIGNNWGLRPFYTRWIRKACLEPIICYGASIWAHGSMNLKKYHVKLRRINRLACLLMCRAMRSTPTKAMEV
ncbi:Uncharacterized protein FKW44_016643, partial [Caligus rogercresseyi]